MPFVIGNETFEKLGSIGTAANLMVYLTSVFHMTNLRAAVALNVFGGTTNLATVFGAFASDLCLGRYATVGFGCVATLIGMIILTLTAGVPALHPPPCSAVAGGQQCAGATKGQLAVLALSFLFIVVGAGGIRPCSLPFGADQFDPNTESGRRGINSFFNWYYFTLTIAVVGSSTGIIYVQSNVSWCIGFAIPTALMFASCVLFFAGAGLYVRVRPEGGIPLASVFRVAVAAARKRRAPAPQDPAASLFRTRHASSLVSRLPYTDQFRFLDKAAVVESDSEVVDDSSGGGGGKPRDPWRLCSLQQVEEAKCVLRIMPVWATCIVYYVAFAQTNTYVVLQAAQSDRRLGPGGFEAPPASFTIFPMLALAVWIPFYDRLVVPWLRGLTGVEGGMTLLQRMGVGMALSVVAMIVAGVVEQRRRELAVLHQAEANRDLLSVTLVSPASAFWLVPQLAALGLSEAFNQVSQMEFYYKQFPENMRSVAGSLIFTGLAMSMYLSGLLVVVVHRATADPVLGDDGWLAENLNRGKLDWFYFLIAFIGAVNFFVFLACAKWYRYKGLDDGGRGGADDDGVHVHVHQWQPTTVQVVDDCPEEGRVVRRRSF
ncbi:protein NRT1/ PTR FAMILY 2.11 [Sorghum bicolor]|nr:protein NRT1/ PTR FAMILY 2.11 [Sorghum bicolor]|eukprot:XP_002461612.2 protein NRT1/ PTR FAMILY 2.11 [Sorghum bicolor]